MPRCGLDVCGSVGGGGHLGLNVWQVAREALELVADLVGELARVAEDQRADRLLLGLELVERREDEDGRKALDRRVRRQQTFVIRIQVRVRARVGGTPC